MWSNRSIILVIARRLRIGLAAVMFTAAMSVRACIWDGDTLLGERLGRPAISALIFTDLEPLRDAPKYREKLKALLAEPKPADPRWINETAGAYLRSGDPQKAVELLEPALELFPSEYGVHANLGTAYHLLGRYADAERQIARDLELNPDAHFGLEKYHLALLQYLVRDDSWKRERVYVDEYSYSLQRAGGGRLFVRDAVNSPPMAESEQRVRLPAYRQRWNLAKDEKRVEGIQYMAELNPREPAAFEMLGVICWARGDLNLAVAAFEKAIRLGSPKSELLRVKSGLIRQHIREAQLMYLPFVGLGAVVIVLVWRYLAQFRRKSA